MCYRLETLDRVVWRNSKRTSVHDLHQRKHEKLDDSFLDGILIRHQTCTEDEGHNQIG